MSYVTKEADKMAPRKAAHYDSPSSGSVLHLEKTPAFLGHMVT